MSDTPRTAAQIIQFGDGPAKYVYASFADKLERENAELQRDKERMDWLMENAICTYYTTWHPRDAEYLANRDEIDEAMGGRK